MNIIQKVMDDEQVAQRQQQILNSASVRQQDAMLRPALPTNNYLMNNLNQAQVNQPAIEQQHAPSLEACEDEPARVFARKSSIATSVRIKPNFMQKNAGWASSKENSGDSSQPAASQNPLTRLRQEIRNQQTNSNLYEQIQMLAEQLRLS